MLYSLSFQRVVFPYLTILGNFQKIFDLHLKKLRKIALPPNLDVTEKRKSKIVTPTNLPLSWKNKIIPNDNFITHHDKIRDLLLVDLKGNLVPSGFSVFIPAPF